MRILKECQICWQETAKNTCKGCGRGLCDSHFNKDMQVCVQCAKGPSVNE